MLFVLGLLAAGAAGPARGGDGRGADSVRYTQAGLRAALLYPAAVAPARAVQAAPKRRIIPLAFALSAAVPGLGQAYNRQWIKAGAAVALEAAVIAAYLTYRERGLDGEDAYKAYAHAFWSPVRYARWLEAYTAFLPDVDAHAFETIPGDVDFGHPEQWSQDDWRRVRTFFNEIRAVEGRVYHPETGASFSHKLPYFAEQQYYELIGKYFQFAPGWEDYPDWSVDGNWTDAIDPEKTGPGGEKVNVRGRFLEYARDHAHANDLLRRASRLSALVVFNHLVAAVDAAVFAKLHNDRLSARLGLTYDAAGYPEPVTTVTLRW